MAGDGQPLAPSMFKLFRLTPQPPLTPTHSPSQTRRGREVDPP